LLVPALLVLPELQDACVIGLNDRGALVAQPVAEVFGAPVVRVFVVSRHGQKLADGLPDVRDRNVVVVDDGVETGSAARVLAAALREQSARRIVLAVPVCSAAQVAPLGELYDDLVALSVAPDGLPLSGHYESFDLLS
jgi:predicted phosphoribosyltransferase